MASVNKQISESNQFDEVALEYHFIAELFHSPTFIIDNLPTSKTRALDLGCGSGVLTNALALHFDQVIGVDLSIEMLSIANHNNKISNTLYVQMDIEDLSIMGQFDFIVTANTFHHLSKLEDAITKVKALLKPNGRLILIDVVSHNETPPRYVYIVGAFQEYPSNLSKYGWKIANRIFKFRISKHWLDHLATDHYLSASSFQSTYNRYLPDCQFPKAGHLIWDKPHKIE